MEKSMPLYSVTKLVSDLEGIMPRLEEKAKKKEVHFVDYDSIRQIVNHLKQNPHDVHYRHMIVAPYEKNLRGVIDVSEEYQRNTDARKILIEIADLFGEIANFAD